MDYNSLMSIAEEEEIEVVYIKLTGRNKGIYGDKVIGLSYNLQTDKEKVCILAEELGHYYTTVGDITDQKKIENRKQELKARRWAVKKLLKVEDFIKAFEVGVRNRAELAEFLEVTEEFIETSLDHFQRIYGHSLNTGNYVVYFSPLWVYKRFE